jgi:hypothetical protein
MTSVDAAQVRLEEALTETGTLTLDASFREALSFKRGLVF